MVHGQHKEGGLEEGRVCNWQGVGSLAPGVDAETRALPRVLIRSGHPSGTRALPHVLIRSGHPSDQGKAFRPIPAGPFIVR